MSNYRLQNSMVSPYADDGLEMETPEEEYERLWGDSSLNIALRDIAGSLQQDLWDREREEELLNEWRNCDD